MNKNDLELIKSLYNGNHLSKKDLLRCQQLLFILNISYNDKIKDLKAEVINENK
jgi:hypothetical protein